MAEKTTGYVPLWPITRKLKAKGLHPDADASEHDSMLYDAWSAHGGVKRLREEFALAMDEAEARLASGELGPVGLAKEKKRIEGEYREKLEAYRPAVDAARKAADRLRGELTARPKPESKSIDEAVERAFRRRDVIKRFARAEPEARREQIRNSLERRDHDRLAVLLSEPELLGEEVARRIEIELMKGGDRRKFGQYEELVGLHDYTGKPDPLNGVIPVLAYALESTLDWFAQQAGIHSSARATEQAVDDKDGAIVLSESEARDPATFRIARDTAAEQGKELKITTEE